MRKMNKEEFLEIRFRQQRSGLNKMIHNEQNSSLMILQVSLFIPIFAGNNHILLYENKILDHLLINFLCGLLA